MTATNFSNFQKHFVLHINCSPEKCAYNFLHIDVLTMSEKCSVVIFPSPLARYNLLSALFSGWGISKDILTLTHGKQGENDYNL